MANNPIPATNWNGIGIVFVAGVAAAIMLAKGSAAAPAVQQQLSLQLAQIGWLMSISNLATLLFGAISGQLGSRFGLATMIKTGLLIMSLAAIASLLSESFAALLTGRAVEGLGIVLVTVAAPALIAGLANNNDRSMAMGIWALWMPVGSVCIMLLSPTLISWCGWRGLWLFAALASMAAWLLIQITQPGNRPGDNSGPKPAAEFDLSALKAIAPWLLMLIFACFSFQFFSVFTFMPIYFSNQLGLSAEQAAKVVAIIPIFIIPGNLLGGWLAKRGLQPWQLILVPALILLVLTQGLFNLDDAGLSATLLLGGYGFVLGIIPTAIFIQAPKLAKTASAAAPIIGLGMSGQGLGILLGPPLTGWLAADGTNWQACADLLSLVLIVLASIALLLARATRQPRPL
ncbi:MAG: MFS transporter [Immundisolibacteraceae bacterium]|nr:MFS transporter [Immundisolibacteraceae bacterium]